MVGQGRPHTSVAHHFDRAPRLGCRLVCAILALLTVFTTRPLFAADAPLRIRVTWGGGAERQWRLALRSESAELSDLVPLGIEADTPGSMWLDGGQAFVRQRSPRGYDAFDVTVAAAANARLSVDVVAADGSGKPVTFEFRLADLVAGAQGVALDERGNRVVVRRAPGDALRVDLPRDNLVFEPGDTLKLDVQPNHLPVAAGTKLKLKAQLVSARTTTVHWSKEFDYKTPAVGGVDPSLVIEAPLPGIEGVYDLVLAVAEEGLRQRLIWSKPLVERRVQVVVVAPQAPAASAGAPWATVVEIDPANPRWYERLRPLSRLPGLRPGSFGNGGTQTWQHALGQLVQIGPAGEASDLHWEAYPLPISRPGLPHILEVDYPTDIKQSLGISVVEPNAAGAMTPVQLDSGLYTTVESATVEPRWGRHRVIFWPRTKSPVILLANRRDGSQAVFGKIRVLAGPTHLPRAPGAPSRGDERLIAGLLNRPLLAENFSASEALDAASGRSLDDWITIHEAGTRLIEYLHYTGQNGVMLSVLADGAAIYPSPLLQASPRYDTGPLGDGGHDAVRKDALELLLRMMDREGLRMIPAVQFASPLPELEDRLRRGGAESVGLQWIGADGRPLADRATAKRGLAPYYNVLHPAVQEAMLRVIVELVERYGRHEALAGLGIELTADGYATLPGDEWGLDDHTFTRFLRDCRLQFAATGETRFAQRARFVMTNRRVWQDWRAERLAEFYQRMHKELAAVNPRAKLYLAGTNLLDAPHLQRELRPAVVGRLKVDEVLRSFGLQPNLLDPAAGIVLLRPQHLNPPRPLALGAVETELNQSSEVDRLFSAGGSVFFHEPQRARLESFDAKSPWGKGKSYCWLVSQMSPVAAHNRARFTQALAANDVQCLFDGGMLLPLGQEDALRPLIAAYRRLPPAAFKQVVESDRGPGDGQPVVLRTAAVGGDTFAYLVNHSPWSVRATVQFDVTGVRLEELTGVRKIAQPQAGIWTVELEPFDLLAVRCAGRVRLSAPKVAFPPDVARELDARVQDLFDRVSVLSSPPPLSALENPGFETDGAAGTPVAGWQFTPQKGTSAVPDAAAPRGGDRAIRLSSAGPVASLRSDPFDPPPTGRISYSVWLRVTDAARQPPLRLALEGVLDDKPYYRLAAVGAGSASAPLRAGWAQFVFQVDDLPLDGLSQLRVRFDLMGSGEVWIDDVQLFDLAFSEAERVELNKLLEGARVSLKQNKVGECARILDGYWPRFLLANVPLTNTPVADRRGAAGAPSGKPAEETKPKKGIKIPFKFLSEKK